MTDTVDTPESVRKLSDQFSMLLKAGWFSGLEMTTINVLTRYAALLEQVPCYERRLETARMMALCDIDDRIAHEKVCAGTWVSVGGGRSPEIGHCVPCFLSGSPDGGDIWWLELSSDGVTWSGHDDGHVVTHWLDARLPGGEDVLIPTKKHED